MPTRSLFDDVRALMCEVISRSDPVRRVEALQIRDDGAVLMVTTAAGVRLVVKLAAAQTDYPMNFERTAVLTALARSTGAPVPEVPAADDSLFRGRWRYLIAEHIDGVRWRELRPRLSPAQVAAAHHALAETCRGAVGPLPRSRRTRPARPASCWTRRRDRTSSAGRSASA